jgi:ABC-2 type transport system permease protein
MGMLSLTLLTPLTLSLFSSFDWRPVWTGYLALVLLGGLFLATGLLASALTENQIVAAFLSFGFLLVLWLVGSLGSILGDTTAGNFFTAVSFIDHFDRLLRGLIDTKDLVYYLSGIVLMLFLAHRVVDAQRWT